MNSTIVDACNDPEFFGPYLSGDSWASWRAFLSGLFALPLDAEQFSTFRSCTGRETPLAAPAREAWVGVGRRAGKSRIAAVVATFAAIQDYSEYLAPGEIAAIPVIAPDRGQSRVILRYVRGFFRSIPGLRALVKNETTSGLLLKNRVALEILTANFRAVRGYTLAAAITDEVAFLPSDHSARPDSELLTALRPALAGIPNSLLLNISSPYARRGELWAAYKKHFGNDASAVLFWKASSRQMNPTLDPKIIARAYEDDPDAAASEYGGEFRSDVAALIGPEVLDACTRLGCFEIAPAAGIHYSGFVDPSGGSADAMTLGISHCEGDVSILDCVRERRPPFSPDDVTAEFAATLKSYGLAEVIGDAYGGQWPRESFAKYGISYQLSEKTRSEIYLAALPLLNAGRVQLLENLRLRAQLLGLERRTARSGRDSVDHGPRGHDDLANAACGALVHSTVPKFEPFIEFIRSRSQWKPLGVAGMTRPASFARVRS